MGMKKIKCEHCGHSFMPRSTRGICPHCKKEIEVKSSQLNPLSCARCLHQWVPRIKDPKLCPNCRTAYWKETERNKKGEIVYG